MSDYVVIARFDEETDEKITHLRELLTDAGYPVSQWPPHITLAAYENFDEKLLRAWTSEFSSRHKKISVALASLSVFPPGGGQTETAVLCLNPAHSKSLVDFYYEFHARYDEYCTGIGWFYSLSFGNPVIHATIGTIRVNELQKAMELVFSSGVFRSAEMIALEVYTYPARLIQRFALK